MTNIQCKQCGNEYDATESACPKCGTAATTETTPSTEQLDASRPPHVSKMGKAIACTILFGYFGIPAIVFSAWSNSCAKQGDLERAAKLNNTARKWINVSLWTGIAIYILLTLYLVLLIAIVFATIDGLN